MVGASETLSRTDGPFIFVTAHLANWELAALAAKNQNIPLSVIYTPEQNWVLQGMIQRKLRSLGCGFISSSEGPTPLFRERFRGEPA